MACSLEQGRSTSFQARPTEAHPAFERHVADIEPSYRLEEQTLQQPLASNPRQQTQHVVQMSSASQLDRGCCHPERTRDPDPSASSDPHYVMLSETLTPSLPLTDPDLQSICGVRAVLDALPGIEHFLLRLSEQLGTDHHYTSGLLHGMFDQFGDKLQEKKRLIKITMYTSGAVRGRARGARDCRLNCNEEAVLIP